MSDVAVITLPAGTVGIAGGWRPVSSASKGHRRIRILATSEVEVRYVRARQEVARLTLTADNPAYRVVDVPPDSGLEVRRPAAFSGAVSVYYHRVRVT